MPSTDPSAATARPHADTLGRSLNGPLVLIGAGKMGSALLGGWLRLGLDPGRIVVVEPDPSPDIRELARKGVALNPAAPSVAAVVVIAVKPQAAASAVSGIRPFVGAGTLVLSVMAGKTAAFLQGALPHGAAVVRAMPNTPAAVGRGMTAAFANARTSADQRALAHALLAAVGEVGWVTDESLMDAVTAVSGSGPAYVFLLAESLARAGQAAGLPADLAETLARATVAGAGELLHRSPLDAAALRENVTSPGGTTAAALAVLMSETGLDPLLREAVLAATRRSRELAG